MTGTPSLPSHKHFSSLSHHTNISHFFIFLPSHKPISASLPSHKHFSSFSHHTNISHLLIYLPSHPPISVFLPSHKHFSSISHHTNISHLSPITQTFFIFSSLSHHTHLSTQHKKNRIDINQSYLKHNLIYLLN